MSDRTAACFGTTRAVSVAAGYTMTLAVTALLLTTVLAGGTGIVESQTDIVAINQLETAGNTLAAEITAVRSIATSPTATNQEIQATVELPERTVTGQYLIEVDTTAITLETTSSDTTVTIPLPSNSGSVDVTSNGRLDGGAVDITYDGGDIVIEEHDS